MKYILMLMLSIVLIGCCTPVETIIQGTTHVIPPINITDTLDYVWLQGYKIGLNTSTGVVDTTSFGYMFGDNGTSSAKVDTVLKKIYFKGKTDTIRVTCTDTFYVAKPSKPVIPESHTWIDWLKVGALGFFVGALLLFILKKFI